MTATAPPEIIISADSHVMEPHELWLTALACEFDDRAPRFPAPKLGEGLLQHDGGFDPHVRIGEMEQDGISAEVLYPTLGLSLFGLDDPGLQEASFRVYNDWLIDYCRVSPDRLIGLACISVYDIDRAVAELDRCRRAGLRGALIWETPAAGLPLYSPHYERFWAAAQDLEMPVNMHILTGFGHGKLIDARNGVEHYRAAVNIKALDAANAVFDLIFYGILDRFPRLKLVIVENEIGWVPFYLQQWDYYYRRFRGVNPPPIDREPSEFFARQVMLTFFNDAVGGRSLGWWGEDNCMWSNDFPHPNSTWPNSRRVIERDLGDLRPEARAKLVRENVANLYGIRMPALT